MKERIKELINEAGIITADYYRNQDDPRSFYSKGIVSEWSEETKQKFNLTPTVRIREMDEETLQKFAELIVKEIVDECAKVCVQHAGWTPRMIAEQVKQHFGVE